jgi:hypothetical protein
VDLNCWEGACQWPDVRIYSNERGLVYRIEPDICTVDGFCWAWKLEHDRESSIEGTAALYQALQVVQVEVRTGHDLGVFDREPELERPQEPVLDQALQLAYLQRWLLCHSVPRQGTVGRELAPAGADVAGHPEPRPQGLPWRELVARAGSEHHLAQLPVAGHDGAGE